MYKMKLKLPDRIKNKLQKAQPCKEYYQAALPPASPSINPVAAAAAEAALSQVSVPTVHPWNGDAVGSAAYGSPTQTADPCNGDALGSIPHAGPTELEAPGDRVQGRVIQSHEYVPHRSPDALQQTIPRRPMNSLESQWTDVSAERELAERLEADDRRSEEWKAEQQIARRRKNASTPNIRRLRQLIREKYRLDVYVWSKRGAQRAMRRHVVERGARSDEILQEIIFIVEAWQKGEFDSTEEWRLAKKIKEGILGPDGKRAHLLWRDVPPWDREEEVDEWEQSSEPEVSNGSVDLLDVVALNDRGEGISKLSHDHFRHFFARSTWDITVSNTIFGD